MCSSKNKLFGTLCSQFARSGPAQRPTGDMAIFFGHFGSISGPDNPVLQFAKNLFEKLSITQILGIMCGQTNLPSAFFSFGPKPMFLFGFVSNGIGSRLQ